MADLESLADAGQPVVSSETDDEYLGVLFHGEGSSAPFPEHSLTRDTLADLNPRQPLTAPVDISLAEAIRMMQEANVGLLALVDGAGRLVGVFTERDVFCRVACRITDLSREKVGDYMTSRLTTLKRTATIVHALHLMAIHRFRHVLMVDDDGKPDGVLSFRAVSDYLEKNFSPDPA
ncbi:MAG: CBS domain-containing protein [Anaerolineae bacterium]